MAVIRFENPDSAPPPIGQYSNVAVVPPGATTAHVAGQLPLDANAAPVAPGDFEAQAEFVFAGLAAQLEGVGSSLRDLAYLRTYLVEDDHYARFKTVRARVFEQHGVTEPPPATTLMVKGLVGSSLIELDAVAVIP